MDEKIEQRIRKIAYRHELNHEGMVAAIREAIVDPDILRHLRRECQMCGQVGTGGTHCSACDTLIPEADHE